MSALTATQIAHAALSDSDNVNIQRKIVNALFLKQNHLIEGICVLADTEKFNVTEIAIERVCGRQSLDLFAFDASDYAQDIEKAITEVVLHTHERPDLY